MRLSLRSSLATNSYVDLFPLEGLYSRDPPRSYSLLEERLEILAAKAFPANKYRSPVDDRPFAISSVSPILLSCQLDDVS